jgi:hypothetical protein
MTIGTFDPQIGEMLPDVQLRALDGRTTIPLRSDGGQTTVVVWRHPFDCDGCDSYLQGLSETVDEFRVWDARLLIVGSPAGSRLVPPFALFAGNDSFLPEGAGVIVADRYGQVFYEGRATAEHTLVAARDLVEWLKYLGTLCPE